MPEEIQSTSQIAEIRAAASVLLERVQFLRQAGISFHGARDLYELLGYDRELSTQQYREMYARGGIAKRVVEALPNATWRGDMWIEEDEDPETSTPLEQTWDDLDTRLKIKATLRRADILTGLSTYAVLLIGAPGRLSDELPKGKPESLLYLQPYLGGGGPGYHRTRMTVDYSDATVLEYDANAKSPRFGQPLTYQLRRIDVASPDLQVPVHWSRVIHLAEGALEDEVFGIPTLESVFNLLTDLEKVTGGGAEAFWLRASQGLHINIDKDLALPDAKNQIEDLKEQAEKYQHQLTRWIRTRGVEVTPLGSDVANFSNPADAILTQIAGSKGIPKRILTGSEMGELASSQDRDNWADQVSGRQLGYVGPYIVRPLVDRLIKYGYLPPPKKNPQAYEVKWPHTQTLTEGERSEGAFKWAQTASAEGPVFTRDEIREKWYGMKPLPKPDVAQDGTHTAPESGLVVQPKVDPETGLPFQAAPKPTIAVDPATGLPVEVDTKVGLPVHQAPKQPLPFGKKPAPTAATDGPHTYGSTQVNLPDDLAALVLAYGATIPDDHLAEKGRETQPHVTVKYGLHTDDANDVARVVAGAGPVTLRLGRTSMFALPDADVVVIDVQSHDLSALNTRLSTQLDVTDTHPAYRPHVTVAYVQSGQGQSYVGDDRFEGLDLTLDQIVFTTAEGQATTIPLGLRVAGDVDGHPFHGNQYTSGTGGKEKEEVFISSPHDAFMSIANGETATVAAGDVRSVLREAMRDKTGKPIHLTKLTVEGLPIFAGGLNRERKTMPQIDKEHQAAFFDHLKAKGITVTKESVAPASLLPTQGEINAARVGEMLMNEKKDLRPIMVSKDSYVLDGHHRWAAMATLDVENPAHIKMPILRLGANHDRALREMTAFNKKVGIAPKALEEGLDDDLLALLTILEAAIVTNDKETIHRIVGV